MVRSPARSAGQFSLERLLLLVSSHSKGILVLFKDCLHVHDLPPSGMQDTGGIMEAEGRVVRVDFTHCGQPLSLVGCYAPNTGAERTAFFRDALAPLMPQDRLTLLGGDLNCVTHEPGTSNFAVAIRLKDVGQGRANRQWLGSRCALGQPTS